MYTNKSYRDMHSAKKYIKTTTKNLKKNNRKFEKGYLTQQLASFCQDWKDPSSFFLTEAHRSTALASK